MFMISLLIIKSVISCRDVQDTYRQAQTRLWCSCL